jgi:hypothetical protein
VDQKNLLVAPVNEKIEPESSTCLTIGGEPPRFFPEQETGDDNDELARKFQQHEGQYPGRLATAISTATPDRTVLPDKGSRRFSSSSAFRLTPGRAAAG